MKNAIKKYFYETRKVVKVYQNPFFHFTRLEIIVPNFEVKSQNFSFKNKVYKTK